MKIPIVNEQDEIIKVVDIKDRKPGEICRITGLWLTDPEGNILLAQRAFNKKLSPGLWGPAAAGTVEEGETYESNIIKEAEEEIGLAGLKPTSEILRLLDEKPEMFLINFKQYKDYLLK